MIPTCAIGVQVNLLNGVYVMYKFFVIALCVLLTPQAQAGRMLDDVAEELHGLSYAIGQYSMQTEDVSIPGSKAGDAKKMEAHLQETFAPRVRKERKLPSQNFRTTCRHVVSTVDLFCLNGTEWLLASPAQDPSQGPAVEVLPPSPQTLLLTEGPTAEEDLSAQGLSAEEDLSAQGLSAEEDPSAQGLSVGPRASTEEFFCSDREQPLYSSAPLPPPATQKPVVVIWSIEGPFVNMGWARSKIDPKQEVLQADSLTTLRTYLVALSTRSRLMITQQTLHSVNDLLKEMGFFIEVNMGGRCSVLMNQISFFGT